MVSQKEEEEECLERLLRRAHDITTKKRERERERRFERTSLLQKREVVFLSPFKTGAKETREKRKKKRTDANNAAVVAAVTAALESFSDKLDAWTTVLLTELLLF